MWAGTREHQYHIPMPWLEQQTTVAKEKGAALWHWVTADPYGNFIIKDIRVAEYNHISTQSQFWFQCSLAAELLPQFIPITN
jgi:hypothetical protein